MLTKLTIKNFFSRFYTYFICLGIFIVGLILAGIVIIGGVQLVVSIQPNNLYDSFYNYFLSFKINDIYEVLNLSILKRMYEDILNFSGGSADNVSRGIFIVIALAVLVIYGSFKGSVALVGTINKKKLSNKQTKKGISPFFVRLLIGILLSAALTVFMKMWLWSGFVILFVYLFVDAIELILTLHYTYFSNIKLKEMFKNKAVFKIMGLYIGWEAVFVIIATLLGFISPIISFVFAVPFLAYNECNITYTVVEYYKEKI